MTVPICLACGTHFGESTVTWTTKCLKTMPVTAPCPTCQAAGTIIHVDDAIAAAVLIMNQRGWHTAFSCAGHIAKSCYSDNFDAYGYVSFKRHVPVPPPLPAGLFYEQDGDGGILRWEYKCYPSWIALTLQLQNTMLALTLWALALPDLTVKTEYLDDAPAS
jgi:hypothetical protein